jgi:hypothetical protein
VYGWQGVYLWALGFKYARIAREKKNRMRAPRIQGEKKNKKTNPSGFQKNEKKKNCATGRKPTTESTKEKYKTPTQKTNTSSHSKHQKKRWPPWRARALKKSVRTHKRPAGDDSGPPEQARVRDVQLHGHERAGADTGDGDGAHVRAEGRQRLVRLRARGGQRKGERQGGQGEQLGGGSENHAAAAWPSFFFFFFFFLLRLIFRARTGAAPSREVPPPAPAYLFVLSGVWLFCYDFVLFLIHFSLLFFHIVASFGWFVPPFLPLLEFNFSLPYENMLPKMDPFELRSTLRIWSICRDWRG